MTYIGVPFSSGKFWFLFQQHLWGRISLFSSLLTLAFCWSVSSRHFCFGRSQGASFTWETIWQSISALSSCRSLLLPWPHSSAKAWDPDLTSGHGCTTTTLLPRLQLDELVWLAAVSGHNVFGGNTDRQYPHPLAAPSRFCAASPCPQDRWHNCLWGGTMNHIREQQKLPKMLFLRHDPFPGPVTVWPAEHVFIKVIAFTGI